jgi:hypothetical protein
MSNGLLLGRNPVAGGCRIGPINDSFDPNQHENGIETLVGGLTYITNNVLHDTTSVTILCGGGGAGELDFILNNVVYNSTPTPLQLDTQNPNYTAFVVNNTFVAAPGLDCVRIVDRAAGPMANLTLQNNHFISTAAGLTPGPGATTLVNDHNVLVTPTAAAGQGYAITNLFAPANGLGGTVNTGVSKPDLLNSDIRGIARPQAAVWDVGAYEFAP